MMVDDSSSSSSTNQMMERVMKQVYGDWDDPTTSGFPLPMPASEAGPSPSGQRRYLWTDAFGVLNLVTLSQRATTAESCQNYLKAADKLVEATIQCLGAPRSPEFPMLPNDRGGFRGMRIGKELSRTLSDDGMTYDGMYWHYIDKWIFALFRLAQAKREPATEASSLIKDVHDRFLAKNSHGEPTGLYWKMNVDLSVIRGLEHTGPNSDALHGWIVYHLVNTSHPFLDKEEKEIRMVAQRFLESGMRVTSDPLGYGLDWWGCQWLDDARVLYTRKKLCDLAPKALDIRHGRQLPFRLYGAIIGAKLSGEESIAAKANEVLSQMVEIELNTPVGSPHSTINKVMFATALDPFSFQKTASEPSIRLLNL